MLFGELKKSEKNNIVRIILFSAFLLLYSLTSLAQKNNQNDYWISFADTTKDKYGYKNQNGDTVIKAGKYNICFTIATLIKYKKAVIFITFYYAWYQIT